MARVLASGAKRLFIGKSNFTAEQIDSAYAGAIANKDTAVSPVNWLQLNLNGAVVVTRSGETLELTDEKDGLADIAISAEDVWEINMPLANIERAMEANMLGLNPGATLNFDSPPSVIGGKLSHIGTSMLGQSFPLLLYLSKYDLGNSTDVPKFGSGSDPNAMCFFKMVFSDRALEKQMDSKAQINYTIKMKPVAVDGITNKGVAFVHGALTALA